MRFRLQPERVSERLKPPTTANSGRNWSARRRLLLRTLKQTPLSQKQQRLPRLTELLRQPVPCRTFKEPAQCINPCLWDKQRSECRLSQAFGLELRPLRHLTDWWAVPWVHLQNAMLDLRLWTSSLGIPEGIVAPFSLECAYATTGDWSIELVPNVIRGLLRDDALLTQAHLRVDAQSQFFLDEAQRYQFIPVLWLLRVNGKERTYEPYDRRYMGHVGGLFLYRKSPHNSWKACWSDPNYEADAFPSLNHELVAQSLCLSLCQRPALLEADRLVNVNACVQSPEIQGQGLCAYAPSLALFAALWGVQSGYVLLDKSLGDGEAVMQLIRESSAYARQGGEDWVAWALNHKPGL